MAVREGLLALLDQAPRHGYQLKVEFEAVTGGVWPLNVGQVYTTLDRLQRDGFVSAAESDDDGPQRIYELTAAGREELGGWWQTVPRDDPPPRDELMLKVLFAIERGPDQGLEVITRQRSALLALLQTSRRDARASIDAAANELAAQLVADAVVVRAEADLRWLDLCESRISTARSTRKDASQ